MMRLKSLEIERALWGDQKGNLIGKIAFEGDTGLVKLNLNEEQCARMLAVVADGVVATAKEVATNLTRECMATIAKTADRIGGGQ